MAESANWRNFTKMTRKQITIIVALGAFVLFEIVVFMLDGSSGSNGKFPIPRNGADSSGVISEEGLPAFSPEVPENIKETPAEISEEIKEGAGAGTKLGVFTITASKKGYEPSVLVVTEGDTVGLKFTSLNGRLDIYSPYIGFYLSADEGGEDQLGFIAPTSGTYLFECRDFCPSGKTIQGQLVVKPKK